MRVKSDKLKQMSTRLTAMEIENVQMQAQLSAADGDSSAGVNTDMEHSAEASHVTQSPIKKKKKGFTSQFKNFISNKLNKKSKKGQEASAAG